MSLKLCNSTHLLKVRLNNTSKKRFKFIAGEFLSRGRPSEALVRPLKTPKMESFATTVNDN